MIGVPRREGLRVIVVTGSEGLIGDLLCRALEASGIVVRRVDVRRSAQEDLLSPGVVERSVEGADGIVHLAAVSRVIWGENDPALCRATNVGVLERLLAHCASRRVSPWLIFASSREVYGDADRLPVSEDAGFRPMNVYAQSKCDGERLVAAARDDGMIANICRFSSVYGSPFDHKDRVAMAFAGAAVRGGTMRVEGAAHTFDFTAVQDVIQGLLRLIEATRHREKLPPIHFVSGVGTTLLELAQMAAAHAKRAVKIIEAPPRNFDVNRFVGDPGRAQSILGWRSTTSVYQGLSTLIDAIQAREELSSGKLEGMRQMSLHKHG